MKFPTRNSNAMVMWKIFNSVKLAARTFTITYKFKNVLKTVESAIEKGEEKIKHRNKPKKSFLLIS